jgi:5-amino-6-(5-phosphoribosylamino)uracil reductase
VALATKLDFDPNWPFFSDQRIERVLVVPDSTPENDLKPFQPLARIFKFDQSKPVQPQIIGYLKNLGCRNLLIEGGGGIMFPWVEQDLIDEWNVTVCPRVIGGVNAPTMVEGNGFDAAHIRNYRLARCSSRSGEVFLKYKRKQ